MLDQVAAQPALTRLVAGLADNKHFLGRRYAEWCTAAPSLEAAVAAAAMAQDEIGHARSLYPLLKGLTEDEREAEPETRTAFVHVPFLRVPFQSWCDFVAANFLVDSAISVLLEGAMQSSHTGLAQRARRILEEERLHWLHGVGWTRRLATTGPAVRARFAEALSASGASAGIWFDLGDPALVSDGILSVDGQQLRQRFGQRVNPILTEVGLPSV